MFLFFFRLRVFFPWIYNSKDYLQHVLKAPSLLCCSGNRLINALVNNLQQTSGEIREEIFVLWVNMSVATSAKWTSIIFSPHPQKWLPWQRHFAIPQCPKTAEYHYIWLPEVLCQHMVLEPRCFITSCFLLSSEKVAWLILSVQLTFSSELFRLCFALRRWTEGKTLI